MFYSPVEWLSSKLYTFFSSSLVGLLFLSSLVIFCFHLYSIILSTSVFFVFGQLGSLAHFSVVDLVYTDARVGLISGFCLVVHLTSFGSVVMFFFFLFSDFLVLNFSCVYIWYFFIKFPCSYIALVYVSYFSVHVSNWCLSFNFSYAMYSLCSSCLLYFVLMLCSFCSPIYNSCSLIIHNSCSF